MKQYDIVTQLLLFAASVFSAGFSLIIKMQNEPEVLKESEKRKQKLLLIGKLLGSVLVGFFVMPGIMDYFQIPLKVTLLLTVVVAYGFEDLLKIGVSRLSKIINGKNESDT